MGFTKTIPKNAAELFDYMKQIHENKGHVKSIKVNNTTGHLEVDLDWTANLKYPDVYMPIRRGKEAEAQRLLTKMLGDSDRGQEPSRTDATALFDLIDQAGQ